MADKKYRLSLTLASDDWYPWYRAQLFDSMGRFIQEKHFRSEKDAHKWADEEVAILRRQDEYGVKEFEL
jgi:hypothetical protein